MSSSSPAPPKLRPGAPALWRRLGAALAAAGTAASVVAQPAQWQGQLALATELTDRGLSVFERRPTVQGEVGVFRGGWGLSVAASTSLTARRDQRLLLRLGRYRPLSDDWQLDAGIGWYGYPGGAGAKAFDRLEAGIGLAFRDLWSVNVTAIDYRAWPGRRAGLQWAFDLGARWPLGGSWSLTASLGQADMPPQPWRRYRYGGFGLAWQRDSWRVELNRLGTDSAGRQMMGPAAQARWSAVAARNF